MVVVVGVVFESSYFYDGYFVFEASQSMQDNWVKNARELTIRRWRKLKRKHKVFILSP